MKKVLLLLVLMTFVVSFAIGCGNDAPAPENSNDAAAPVAAGPTADDPIRMTLATSWPTGMMLHYIPQHFGQLVEEMSGGRLLIDVQPGGAIVGPGEVLDAAEMGTIDAYHSFSGYWLGKMPAAPFFSSVPMTMEPFPHLVWIYEGGGWELWQKMYEEAGYNNVKVIPCGIVHPEILAWANVPLTQIEDWQGLKYRTVGWWGEILEQHDVAVTSLPAAELYPSLDTGILDATEFSTPYTDRELGFYEVAQYFTGPGMHQPSVLFEVTFNQQSWDSLPDDLQAIVLQAAHAATLWGWTHDAYMSMDALDFYAAQGNTQLIVDEEVQLAFAKTTNELLNKRAAEEGGVFEEIWESMKEFQNRFYDFEDFMMPVRYRME